MSKAKPQQNRLANSTSPYLQQHADNPVDWYSWGKEALQKARDEDKPILLSIGYSACHWCHVMAHESFEDEETAEIMNRYFINIKVDREQRPDLDKIYQTAHQLLLRRGGGWPLTMFLSPENQIPFFGGTYFPKSPTYGMACFQEILLRVAHFFKENRDEITQQNTQTKLVLAQLSRSDHEPDIELNDTPIKHARTEIGRDFDPMNKGFGEAPKFPQTTYLQRLLQYWSDHKEDHDALAIVEQTLTKMTQSGIYDQVGGGFFRYSVDKYWMIPHFEKMLYDNALLLDIYVEAFRATKNKLFICTILGSINWVIREMQSPEGGYYSTLDADSEAVEGKYYYWDREQIRSSLSDDEYQVIIKMYGIDRAPNFENHWHLHSFHDFKETCQTLNIAEKTAEGLLHQGLKKLFDIREQRIRPHRDEKVLTAWNGLMIKAMAKAGYILEREEYIDSACKALDFIKQKLCCNGQLMACYKDGKAEYKAYLDDYAFLLDALMSIMQIRFRIADFEFALELAKILAECYRDELNGGFFFTAHDHEQLIQRPKPLMDEATPAGNGIAATALLQLGYFTAKNQFIEMAEDTIIMAWKAINQLPSLHCSLVQALDNLLVPPTMVIIRGDKKLISQWQRKCLLRYNPHLAVFAIETKIKLPKELANYKAIKDKAVAYVCHGKTCSQPISELKLLLKECIYSPKSRKD